MLLQREMLHSDRTVRGTMSGLGAGGGGQLDPADCVILRETHKKKTNEMEKQERLKDLRRRYINGTTTAGK